MSQDFKELFFGAVDAEGKLKLERKDRFQQALRRFAGKEVQLTIDRRTDGRTNNQNRYYWGAVVTPLAEYLGYADPEELHEILKAKFLRRFARNERIGFVAYAGSTVKLDTLKFEEYLEKIRTWALADLNFKIALPGEIEMSED